MQDDKSSPDLFTSGGVGGECQEGGESGASQGHLFTDTKPLWQVIDKREEKIWNEGFKIFQSFPTYAKTRPLNWKEPQPEEGLPWE